MIIKTTGTERVRVLESNGNVGIGNINPNYPLDIAGSVGPGGPGYLVANFNSQQAGASIQIQGTSNNTYLGVDLSGNSFVGGALGAAGKSLRLFSNNAENMTITGSGNVGIGTTSPAAKLDVNGNIAIAGTPVIDANRNRVGNPTVPVGPGGTPINPQQVALLKWAPHSGLSFPVGSAPYGVAFDGANIWIANNGSNTVTKLRVSDSAVQGTFSVGTNPRGVAFDGANIWVANYFSNNVTKLRASDGALQGTFSVGNNPSSVASDGPNIWVANQGGFPVPYEAAGHRWRPSRHFQRWPRSVVHRL